MIVLTPPNSLKDITAKTAINEGRKLSHKSRLRVIRRKNQRGTGSIEEFGSDATLLKLITSYRA